MAGLQRSAQTFRRSGSSGLVWDERFLTDGAAAAAEDDGGARGCCRQPELRHSRSVGSMMMRRGEAAEHGGDTKRTKLAVLAKAKPKQQERRRQKEEEEVVHGRTAFRTRDVAPAAEPPSPRVPAGCCAPCAIFRAPGGAGTASTATLARRTKGKSPCMRQQLCGRSTNLKR